MKLEGKGYSHDATPETSITLIPKPNKGPTKKENLQVNLSNKIGTRYVLANRMQEDHTPSLHSRMQKWLNIHKSIHLLHHIDKNNNHLNRYKKSLSQYPTSMCD